MFIKKKNIDNILIYFLFIHLIIWTLIPSISNTNLPLDTIETLAWGSNLDWGYSKHPPFSAWFAEFFYQIFANQDWSYYLLCQFFVVTTFFIIFKFSEIFLKDKLLSLISVLLLEGIFFYNFTTPEFNVNISQLPFWALTVYFAWKGTQENNYSNWLLVGLFSALGFLSKYLFVYLLVAIDIFLIYLIYKKIFNFKCLASLIFFVLILPHIFWLTKNDYTTIAYALGRTGIENSLFLEAHLLNPLIFLGKQIIILLPFFIMLFLIIQKTKIKINFKDQKLVFLLIINLAPLALMFLTSFIMGAKIRTMWMAPFYMFFGVLFLYIFKEKIVLKKLKYFFSMFLILFIFSPAAYLYVSLSQSDKRTDYPGKKISNVVQKKWNNNFTNKIGLVAGDEWHGGNLSYHLESRPKWDNILESKKNKSLSSSDGFVLIGDPKILEEICGGVFFKIEKQGVCMIGDKK